MTASGLVLATQEPGNVTGHITSMALLLTPCDELELVEVDGLVAGAAAVGPAA